MAGKPRAYIPPWIDFDRLAQVNPAPGWEREGACYEQGGTERFYPEGQVPQDIQDLCAACPARYACLKTAVMLSETNDHGVWGGTSQRQRQKIRQRLAARSAA